MANWKVLILFLTKKRQTNNLAWQPIGVSWPMFRQGPKHINEVLTCKKALSLSHWSGQSFLCVAYCKVVAFRLLKEDANNQAHSVVEVPSSGSVSPLSCSSYCSWVLFPSTSSGGGLDLSIALCRACLAEESRMTVPSLWREQRHCKVNTSWDAWEWAESPEDPVDVEVGAIGGMIWYSEKTQPLISILGVT